MQATVVMLIALGGLGCQNPVSDRPPALPDAGPSLASPSNAVSTVSPAPSPYPVYTGARFDDSDESDDESFGSCVRNTFCSFFIGRDPGVPTARQIEAAYYSGQYNQ